MAKIAIISYAEDEYDIDEVEDMTPEDFDSIASAQDSTL